MNFLRDTTYRQDRIKYLGINRNNKYGKFRFTAYLTCLELPLLTVSITLKADDDKKRKSRGPHGLHYQVEHTVE